MSNGDIDGFLLDQIKRHEGYRRKPYKCTAGKLTIGIGRNLDDVGISEREALYLCTNDLENSDKELSKNLIWYLGASKRRRQAMINLHFNMGMAKLMQFKNFLQAMKDGDYETAAKELLNSKYAKQVGKRADELADQIRAG